MYSNLNLIILYCFSSDFVLSEIKWSKNSFIYAAGKWDQCVYYIPTIVRQILESKLRFSERSVFSAQAIRSLSRPNVFSSWNGCFDFIKFKPKNVQRFVQFRQLQCPGYHFSWTTDASLLGLHWLFHRWCRLLFSMGTFLGRCQE